MPVPLRPRGGQLWSSAEVARVFRVGVSSVKRWTDEGELESVRTPGGHRRYTLAALHRFASIRRLPTDLLPPLDSPLAAALPPPADITLYEALARGDAEAVRRLVTPRVDSVTQRATFLDRVVGDALREIGWRWERHELDVEEEHRASRIVEDAVDRLRPPLSNDGPLAFLCCPPDEWHDLPLRLVRLVLEWNGWRTELAGASLPWLSCHHAVSRAAPAILGFSSRNGSFYEQRDFAQLVRYARERGTTVIVGGEWARGGASERRDYLRFRSLRGFERWLRGEAAAARDDKARQAR
jgi:MerR family transcriptional regulator, light-induced transcriptional regulator